MHNCNYKRVSLLQRVAEKLSHSELMAEANRRHEVTVKELELEVCSSLVAYKVTISVLFGLEVM